MFKYVWLIILGLLWLYWTLDSLDDYLIYWSFHKTEKRRYWIKRGRPNNNGDYVKLALWLIIHITFIFFISLGYYLEIDKIL